MMLQKMAPKKIHHDRPFTHKKNILAEVSVTHQAWNVSSSPKDFASVGGPRVAKLCPARRYTDRASEPKSKRVQCL